MAQGSVGRVRVFEDFTDAIAGTLSDATEYRRNGVRIAAISGDVAETIEADEPNGVVSFSGAGQAGDGVAIFALPFQPSTQGVMSVEARWQSSVVSDYRFFIGWQETVAVAEPVNPFTLSGTTLTSNNGGQAVGLYFDAQATTDDVRFHASSDGAELTTALTDEGVALGALGVRANVTVAADSYNVARVILEPDGRAEAWYGIGSGKLQLVGSIKAGNLDTAALYHPILLLSCHSTGDPFYSVDYFLAEGGRSWAA